MASKHTGWMSCTYQMVMDGFEMQFFLFSYIASLENKEETKEFGYRTTCQFTILVNVFKQRWQSW